MSEHPPNKPSRRFSEGDGKVDDLERVLNERTSSIVEAWRELLPAKCFALLGEEVVQQRLTQWAAQVVTLLMAKQRESLAAQTIGRQLANLPCVELELLGHSQAMLIEQLLPELPIAQQTRLWPPLSLLLTDIATGFVRELQRAILTEQEQLRLSLWQAKQQAEQALRRSEARYRQMWIKNRAIKLLIDPTSGAILDANPAACQFYGYGRAELLSMTIADVNALSSEEVRAKMARAEREQQLRYRFRHRLASGEVREVEVFTSPVDIDGRALLYSIIHDVTARTAAQAELAAARRRLAEVREAERLGMARVLHDEAVQQLLGISYQVLEVQDVLQGESPDMRVAARTLAEVHGAMLQVVDHLRGTLRELRPPSLQEMGLTAALRGYLDTLRIQHGAALPQITIDSDLKPLSLPNFLALSLFRIAQEGLRNALRHAKARHIWLRLQQQAGVLELRIEDDGQGFQVPTHLSQLTRTKHYGLVGLAERVEEIGGQLAIRSQPGDGMVLIVRVPFEA